MCLRTTYQHIAFLKFESASWHFIFPFAPVNNLLYFLIYIEL